MLKRWFLVNNFKYVPFLKLKANEVAGFSALDAIVKTSARPLFDLPRKKELESEDLRSSIDKASKKLKKYLNDQIFYIDNLDIPDDLLIDGDDSYFYLLKAFHGQLVVPVVGIDRSERRNEVVFQACDEGLVDSDEIAFRILPDEFISFDAVVDDLAELFGAADEYFSRKTLILDGRLCSAGKGQEVGRAAGDFIASALNAFNFDRVIFSGSSLPPSIAEIVKPNHELDLHREELDAVLVARQLSPVPVIFGDYTIVSPYYSEVDLPPEMLLNIMAPKIIYSHRTLQTIIRGGALKTHPRGSKQYNDFAAEIVRRAYYRSEYYSVGDAWLHRNKDIGVKAVTASSVLAPTINAHMTYMCVDHPLCF